VWDVETVRVVGDVTIEDGVTVTIMPGVLVEFEDYYRLEIAGTLLALGTPGALIRFTTDDPQDFRIDQSHAGCWNGIRFHNTSAANAPSRLAHCIIEYSKATGGGTGPYPYGGGALSAVDCSKLTIEHCIIRNNVADYGGAMFLYRNASPRILDNLIVENHALQNAAAIYCAYSYPKLVNNTIVGNRIHNENNPYIESCAALSFISKPVFSNNIIRENDPDTVYMHSQLWNNKDHYTHYNNIEDYKTSGGNIDADPLFVAPGSGDYHLGTGSPCIDAADNTAVPEDITTDIDGDSRFVDDPDTEDTGHGDPPIVDMGADEYQPPECPADFDGDGDVDTADLLHLLGAWGTPAGDVDDDGDTDTSDLLALLAAWGECP